MTLTWRQLKQVIGRHSVSVLWLTATLFHQVIDEDVGALTGVRKLHCRR